MFPLLQLFVFTFGLFIGSFLNVVIFRLHSGEPIVIGRSHCVACKKPLSWYELIPVFSFLLQQGKCRSCGIRLSWQYPLVELATAGIFVLGFMFLPTIAYLPPFLQSAWSAFPLYAIFSSLLPFSILLFLCSVCIVIFVYDLRYLLIPDAVILWGIVLVLFAEILGIWRVPTIAPLLTSNAVPGWEYVLFVLITAGLCALPFFLIVFFSSGKWMGLGDVKLAFFMGMVLGVHAYLAIFIGVSSGAIIGIALMASGKAGMRSLIPFGPFLVFGTLVVLFWGQGILDYLGRYFWLPL